MLFSYKKAYYDGNTTYLYKIIEKWLKLNCNWKLHATFFYQFVSSNIALVKWLATKWWLHFEKNISAVLIIQPE